MATQKRQKDAFDSVLFGWYAPEFIRYERTNWWYLIAGLADLALLVYAIWSGSWSMALVFALLPVIYFLEHRVHPKPVEVIFSAYGIRYGKQRFSYSNIEAFWIFHEPPYMDELHIRTGDKWHPEVVIPLMGADPTELRQFLVTQIPEWEGKKPSFIDNLVRFLKLA